MLSTSIAIKVQNVAALLAAIMMTKHPITQLATAITIINSVIVPVPMIEDVAVIVIVIVTADPVIGIVTTVVEMMIIVMMIVIVTARDLVAIPTIAAPEAAGLHHLNLADLAVILTTRGIRATVAALQLTHAKRVVVDVVVNPAEEH